MASAIAINLVWQPRKRKIENHLQLVARKIEEYERLERIRKKAKLENKYPNAKNKPPSVRFDGGIKGGARKWK